MGERKEICILIASSQPSLRKGLKMFLNEESGLCVVAEAGDSHELIKKFESTHPDIVLLDWDLLDRATPILIKTISSLDQKTTLIVLSAKSDHMQVAMESGADSYVDISNPPGELLVTINKTLRRYNYK